MVVATGNVTDACNGKHIQFTDFKSVSHPDNLDLSLSLDHYLAIFIVVL
jgi:hypothetical protein